MKESAARKIQVWYRRHRVPREISQCGICLEPVVNSKSCCWSELHGFHTQCILNWYRELPTVEKLKGYVEILKAAAFSWAAKQQVLDKLDEQIYLLVKGEIAAKRIQAWYRGGYGGSQMALGANCLHNKTGGYPVSYEKVLLGLYCALFAILANNESSLDIKISVIHRLNMCFRHTNIIPASKLVEQGYHDMFTMLKDSGANDKQKACVVEAIGAFLMCTGVTPKTEVEIPYKEMFALCLSNNVNSEEKTDVMHAMSACLHYTHKLPNDDVEIPYKAIFALLKNPEIRDELKNRVMNAMSACLHFTRKLPNDEVEIPYKVMFALLKNPYDSNQDKSHIAHAIGTCIDHTGKLPNDDVEIPYKEMFALLKNPNDSDQDKSHIAYAIGTCLEETGKLPDTVIPYSEMFSLLKNPNLSDHDKSKVAYTLSACIEKTGKIPDVVIPYLEMFALFRDSSVSEDTKYFVAYALKACIIHLNSASRTRLRVLALRRMGHRDIITSLEWLSSSSSSRLRQLANELRRMCRCIDVKNQCRYYTYWVFFIYHVFFQN